SFWLRFDTPGLEERLDALLWFLPGFLLYAAGIYRLFQLYKGKWRFASLPDLFSILRAVSVLAISLLVLDYVLVAPNFLGAFFFGKLTIILYWFLQMFLLGGPRVAYRYFRFSRTRLHAMAPDSAPILVLGSAADVEALLLRPSVSMYYRRLERFVAGKSIVVTGGGGSIGGEICDRIVTFGAARVLVIENSEPALHAVLEALRTKQASAMIEGRLADV